VTVSGPVSGGEIALRAGQRLVVDLPQGETRISEPKGDDGDEVVLGPAERPAAPAARSAQATVSKLDVNRRWAAALAAGHLDQILSAHDFTTRPDRLYSILAEMTAAPADVSKIVWTARTLRDNLEAFEILAARQKPTIALCMGEAGLLSRVLAKKFGAFLTFASLTKGAETAPGQVSIHDMKRCYRWDAQNPDTRIYGVVGFPVAHSMSPAIHNAGFDAVSHDGFQYMPETLVLEIVANVGDLRCRRRDFLDFEAIVFAARGVALARAGLNDQDRMAASAQAASELVGAPTAAPAIGRKRVRRKKDPHAIRRSMAALSARQCVRQL